MKTGRTIESLAAELTRQHEAKRDYVADTRRMEMTPDAQALRLEGVEPVEMTQHARRQLATRLDIPGAFFDRLQTKHPDILKGMVNTLFQREPQMTMVRTLDGKARGIMSNGYRTLDNYDLADAVLPALVQAGAEILSCEVTETRMYVKGTIAALDRMLPVPAGLVMGKGHTIFPRALRGAFSISNSEVGAGGVLVNPAVLEKACTNLAVFKDEGFSAIHLGKRKGEDDAVREYLTDATKRLEDAAIWAKVRDTIKAICDGRVMDKIVAGMLAAREDVIEGDPAKVVEVFGKKNDLNEEERGGLLRHLVASGEPTRYGLQWAVTRLAGEVEDYDRASELERLGGKVIELPKSDWKVLLKAA